MSSVIPSHTTRIHIMYTATCIAKQHMHAHTHISTHPCYKRTHMHAKSSWPPHGGVWERNILATQQQFERTITTTPLCQDIPLRTRSPMHTDTTQPVCPVIYTLTHTQKKNNQNKTQKSFLPKTSTCRDGTKLDGNNTATSPHHPYILCRFVTCLLVRSPCRFLHHKKWTCNT